MLNHFNCPSCRQPINCLDLVNRDDLVVFNRREYNETGAAGTAYWCIVCALVGGGELAGVLPEVTDLLSVCPHCNGGTTQVRAELLDVVGARLPEWTTYHVAYPMPDTFKLKDYNGNLVFCTKRLVPGIGFRVLPAEEREIPAPLPQGALKCKCNSCSRRY